MPSPQLNQIDGLVNEIFKQSSAINGIAQIDAKNFVSSVQAALLFGYDFITNSISQVLSRTIFAIRPYREKMQGLDVTTEEWGNHFRKISVLEKNEFQQNPQYQLVDGQSVDQQKVILPSYWQGNFYNEQTYMKQVTVPTKQFREALKNYGEFQQLIDMIITQSVNQISMVREGLKRETLVNAMASIIQLGGDNVIHLLTEYNAATGKSYTQQDMMNPDVYRAFMQWAFARIQNVSDFLTDNSVLYHTNPEAGYIMRHTPKEFQRGFMLAQYQAEIDGIAKAQTFHENYMQQKWTEVVNFWQSPTARDEINIIPQYMLPSGALANSTTAVQQANVFGAFLDKDMCGVNICDEWQANSPFNAAAGYYNIFWHFTGRYYNDNTENGVVFLLD